MSARASSAAHWDEVITRIADYVVSPPRFRDEARSTARLCLLDSIGCALAALEFDACTRLIAPPFPGSPLSGGARVPGTDYVLDPIQAAFSIGAMIRWLDFNDTWLAAEWGHPSDNFGAILACADYRAQQRVVADQPPLTIGDVLDAAIKAYEIQGVLALQNAFNRIGLDHVILVRVASAALATQLLGGDREQIAAAVSNAWIDGGALRTYRQAPNVGPRKSWAAGDATSRGVWLALLALKGEPGYATCLSAPAWGFSDVLNRGAPLILDRQFGSYVMENVLFKVSYPAEFHAQTAVEAAIRLHRHVRERLDEIEAVIIETQESAIRIIDKTGPLRNPADRDHCLQYMVAVALTRGDLTAQDYEDDGAADPRIDTLRARMVVIEEPRFTRDYLDPEKRSVSNAIQIRFDDGSLSDRVEVEYPIGHRRRRSEALPLLRTKLGHNLDAWLEPRGASQLLAFFDDPTRLDGLPVNEFMSLLAR